MIRRQHGHSRGRFGSTRVLICCADRAWSEAAERAAGNGEMIMKRRRYDTDDGDDIVPPGGRVRVVLNDAARQRRALSDAVSRHMSGAGGHRPMQCTDALRYGGYSLALDARVLADAFAARDRAFRDLERRSAEAWKQSLNATPPENYDQLKPPRDDNEDEADDDNGEPDLDKLMQAKEDAYQARNARGDAAYKNPPSIYTSGNLSGNGGVLDPTTASRIEKQAETWRHGK